MFNVGLIIASVAVFLTALMLVMPVRFRVDASGGYRVRLSVSGAVMIYSGLIGCKIRFEQGSGYGLSVLMGRRRVLTVDITSVVHYFKKREKKEKKQELPDEAKPPLEPGKTLISRISEGRETFSEYWPLARPVIRDLKDIVRVDTCAVDIMLGLGDPALTGKVVGIIYAVNSVLPKPFAITPSWDFSRAAIGGEAVLEVTVSPMKLWKRAILSLPPVIAAVRRKRKRNSVAHAFT